MTNKNYPQLKDAKAAKEFFSLSMKSIFSPFIHVQSEYREGDIVSALRNAISMKQYVETYVRNNPSPHTPSGDTIFRRIRDAESHDTVAEKGNVPDSAGFQYDRNTGSGILSGLIDATVKTAISAGYFREPVNVAIDEHDTPYYGMDQPELINAPYHRYRGTDRAYRFATLESVKPDSRLTLSVLRKTPLDGIDNTAEVGMLLKHALDLGIRIGFVLMDRGYLDAGVMEKVDGMKLKYIIPAKENSKVKRFKSKEIQYSEGINAKYLILRDTPI